MNDQELKEQLKSYIKTLIHANTNNLVVRNLSFEKSYRTLISYLINTHSYC
jgi:hypothetical protein